MELRTVTYDHPDAVKLGVELQQEYVLRYGGVDETPVEQTEFVPPNGLFLVGYLDGEAVAAGCWRACAGPDPSLVDGDAEVKRMYVVQRARGRGFARALLVELERTITEAGFRRIVLQSGDAQPEALALYESAGYHQIPGYGIYRSDPQSRYFGKLIP